MFSSNLVSASLVFHCSFGSFIAFLNVWYTSTTLDFSFRMVQVHFFNIVFAVLNTLVTSSRDFEFIDLWCALAGAVGYALLYLLVLDRFGIHLYPVFSPRSVWSMLSWSALLGTYFLVFHAWNGAISKWSPLFREFQGID